MKDMALFSAACAALASFGAAADVAFSVRTIPVAAGLTASVEARRDGDVWRVTAMARRAANSRAIPAFASSVAFA